MQRKELLAFLFLSKNFWVPFECVDTDYDDYASLCIHLLLENREAGWHKATFLLLIWNCRCHQMFFSTHTASSSRLKINTTATKWLCNTFNFGLLYPYCIIEEYMIWGKSCCFFICFNACVLISVSSYAFMFLFLDINWHESILQWPFGLCNQNIMKIKNKNNVCIPSFEWNNNSHHYANL